MTSPINDDFSNSILLDGNLITNIVGNNFDATGESGEPIHDNSSVLNKNGELSSVWWSWTASANGIVEIDTIGSDFDTVLAVYTGSSVSNLTPVTSNDNVLPISQSRVSFDAILGTTYHIAVDSIVPFSQNEVEGNIALNLNATKAGLNPPVAKLNALIPNLRMPWLNTKLLILQFSEEVVGVDISDLTLMRDGELLSLEEASISEFSNYPQTAWSINLPSRYFSELGTYVLSLNAGTSGIVDLEGNPLANSPDVSYVVNLLDSRSSAPEPISSDSESIGLVVIISVFDAIDFGGKKIDQFIKGTLENDRIKGTPKRDLIFGKNGDDQIIGQQGNDRVIGQGGRDRIKGCNGNDQLLGGSHNDRLIGNAGNDLLRGQGGRDRLKGGRGNDQIVGGSQTDSLLGQGGNDLLRGQGERDRLNGGSGNDILIGGLGRDILIGGNGQDIFVYETLADAGDSIQDFNPVQDLIDLRPLIQSLGLPTPINNSFPTTNPPIPCEIVQVGGNSEIRIGVPDGISGNDFTVLMTLINTPKNSVRNGNFIFFDMPYSEYTNLIVGGSGNDQLSGSNERDKLVGDPGDDLLIGYESSDYLQGNEGNDVLIGGSGSDQLVGGKGQDIFVYETLEDAGDSILDFELGDLIDFRPLVRSLGIPEPSSNPFDAPYPPFPIDIGQVGSDVEIRIRPGYDSPLNLTVTIATLIGMSKSSIGGSDFIFHDYPLP
jgi:Ca2+-binding RTX toxin-like protein